MYYLQFEDCQIVGSSPEILVTERRGDGSDAPIAGTVRRGGTPEEDRELEAKLLADPKERAEHVMLVDLRRNDIGRVCEYGSVVVDELLVTESTSHVIHIVSNMVGRLAIRTGMRSTCCAPPSRRGRSPALRRSARWRSSTSWSRCGGRTAAPSATSSFSGDMDTAITIRTFVVQDQTAYMQAGAGIVADSVRRASTRIHEQTRRATPRGRDGRSGAGVMR